MSTVFRTTFVAASMTLSLAIARPVLAGGQDAAQIAKGQAVYVAQKCSMCHGIAGKGSKSNPLDGVGAKLSADDIKQWITHPVDAAAKAKSTKKPLMPAKWASLPAADLDALVAYLSSLK